MRKAISFITNGQPWAIEPEALQSIITIANRENNIDMVLAERGKPLDNTRKIEMRGNVAVIQVDGPLFPKANMFSEVSGAYSVEMLVQDLAKAQADNSVRAVVIAANSPGGHTTMINEASQFIKDFSKPIETYVVGQAASAMYWLASATDKITLDKLAIVGSIGVVGAFTKDDGKTIEIVSSNAPDKRPDLGTDAGKEVVRAIFNDMEAVFIETVANNRNMTHEQVTALRGGVVVGARAVGLGFADAVGSLESVILRLQQETNPMDLNTLKTAHAEAYQAAFNEGVASVNITQAVQASNARIAGILNHEQAVGREAQAKILALETEMTVDQAAKVLAASPVVAVDQSKNGGNQFAAAMDKLGNPKIGTEDGNVDDDQAYAAQAQAGWARAAKNVIKLRGGK